MLITGGNHYSPAAVKLHLKAALNLVMASIILACGYFSFDKYSPLRPPSKSPQLTLLRIRQGVRSRKAKKNEQAATFEEQKAENAKRVNRLSQSYAGGQPRRSVEVDSDIPDTAPPGYETVVGKGGHGGRDGDVREVVR